MSADAASTVRCYNQQAAEYDRYQSFVVPKYEEALSILARTAARRLPEAASVLDLGCGTGNASVAVHALRPRARFHLLDGAAAMAELAEEKLRALDSGLVLGSSVADLASHGWRRDLADNSFDAIISSFVLEHLPFPEYEAVIAGCRRLLKPRGMLLSIEGYDEPGSGLLQAFEQEMEERRRAFPDPALAERIGLRLRRVDEKHYYTSPAARREVWLVQGFTPVYMVWQYLCIGLMMGETA